MKIVLLKNKKGEWFWHVLARNGKKVATSGEPFDNRGNAARAAHAFIRNLIKAHTGGKLEFEQK